jgi:hypothetical protein
LGKGVGRGGQGAEKTFGTDREQQSTAFAIFTTLFGSDELGMWNV